MKSKKTFMKNSDHTRRPAVTAAFAGIVLAGALMLGGCGGTVGTGTHHGASPQKIVTIAPEKTTGTDDTVTKETVTETVSLETVAETENVITETVSETEQKTEAEETSSETNKVSASTPITNDSYEVITKYIKDLGFVSTMWSDTWDNWLYVIDDHHANLILIEDPADFPYGNYLLFIAVPLSCDQKVHWDDEASVASLANEAERMEKDVLYELLTEEEVKEVIASYAR